MSGPTRPVPPAVEEAHRILAEEGPLSGPDLKDRLKGKGFVVQLDRIQRYPDLYPRHIQLTPEGQLRVAASAVDDLVELDEDPPTSGDWFRPCPGRAAPGRIGVLDIETTGFSPAKDVITAIALVRLDGVPILNLAVRAPGGEQDAGTEASLQAVPIAEALEQLRAALGEFDLLIGQNLPSFDVPFLRRAAESAGLDSLVFPECADSIHLSLLVDVALPNRGLADVLQHYGLTNQAPSTALGDAVATAEAVRAMRAAIDVREPSWQLAIAALESHEHALVRIMPDLPGPPDLATLQRPADPLLQPTASAAGDTWTVTREAFGVIEQKRNWRTRSSQREMANAVAEVFERGGRLAVEAPTGTGKSLAYLLPAVGRGSRPNQPVVIATATKALQAQLREEAAQLRDEGLLAAPFRQIQGVSNYVCARELEDLLEDREASGLALAVGFRAIATAPTGTWDDVTDDTIRRMDVRYARTRARARTNSGGCEKAQCKWASTCPLVQQITGLDKKPGIVSVNHALVASWVKLEKLGGHAPGDVLASGRADLVFDEAHRLEDSLTSAWTEQVDALELQILVNTLSPRTRLMRNVVTQVAGNPEARAAIEAINAARREVREAGKVMAEAVSTYLHEYAGKSSGATLQSGVVTSRPEFRVLRQASSTTRYWLIQLAKGVAALTNSTGDAKQLNAARRRLRGYSDRLSTAIEVLDTVRELPDPHLWVYRLSTDEDDPTAWTFERLPIHVFPAFQQDVVDRSHSTTLCSATLTVEQRFEYIASRLGVQIRPEPDEIAFRSLRLGSPFDYKKQALVILTNHLPVPIPSNEREFCEEMAADQVGFLSLSGGKTLTLFASRVRMEAVAEEVRAKKEELASRGVELLVQGEQSRSQIAHRFRTEPGTVLYGLKSYWEGFDAPGETLSYLFIEKPPYPHPDDPLVSARKRAIAERGGDPFLDYVLPMTAMEFTQGFGRLIRKETDRGAAFVCDRRLHAPNQAQRVILGSLPDPERHEAEDRDDAWTKAIEFVTGEKPNLEDAISLGRDDVSQILDSLRLIPGEDPTAKLLEVADKLFGIKSLHPKQLEVMKAFIEGRDLLAILPTGFGKSLCFQLPALLAPEARATVVVSPLIALIKDQVNDLRGRRGIRPVQGITGSTSRAVQTEILRDTAEGKVRLLYVSPERLARDPTLRGALRRQQLNGVIVDEAHCISVWGHDFRPEFRAVPQSVATFDIRPQRGGFTATATPEVEIDIARSMDMHEPLIVRESADRPNLRFRVQRCVDERERARQLLRFVQWSGTRPGIVYVTKRALAEEVAALLRRAGHTARAYHAGMVPEQRDAVQEDFDSDSTRIIVATKAFGMGINKPNIGWVVHYDLPDSLDGYAQEAGRAARTPDITGDCFLMFTWGDIKRRRRLVEKSGSKADVEVSQKLLEKLWQCPKRGDSRVFDADEMADELELEDDELNVHLAQLERAGVLKQELDCSARGTVDVGYREPTEDQEKLFFRELFYKVHRAKPEVKILLDFEKLEREHGYDPDELEQQLISWSLDRLVTFSSSRRLRRVQLIERSAPPHVLVAESERWRQWQGKRLDAMIDYAEDKWVCRRILVGKHFGDDVSDCTSRGIVPCDVCSGEEAAWSSLPDHLVPDPEMIVNTELTVLQSVAWASAFRSGAYGEASLRAAVLGRDSLGEGRPLGAGVLNCPQFGAMRYLRSAERRWEEALKRLIDDRLVERRVVDPKVVGRKSYQSLALTTAGAQTLGIQEMKSD
jgi:ATP-dependent DNA helicase RecQ